MKARRMCVLTAQKFPEHWTNQETKVLCLHSMPLSAFFYCTHLFFELLLLLVLYTKAAYYLGRLYLSSFKKYLLSIYYIPGTVPDAKDAAVNKVGPGISSLHQFCSRPRDPGFLLSSLTICVACLCMAYT